MITTTIVPQPNTVKYNNNRHRWQVISYPTGPEGHRRAMLAALESEIPDVVDEVRAIIHNARQSDQAEEIARRALKAALIIRDGKIWPPVAFNEEGGCLNEIARIQGSRGEMYILSWDGEEAHCDCPDYQLENAPVLPSGQRACKHIISILILEAVREF